MLIKGLKHYVRRFSNLNILKEEIPENTKMETFQIDSQPKDIKKLHSRLSSPVIHSSYESHLLKKKS